MGAAVFVELDRALLPEGSIRVLRDALAAEGCIPAPLSNVRRLERCFDRLLHHLGRRTDVAERLGIAEGWSVDDVRRAGEGAVDGLVTAMAPYAPSVLAEFRRAGHLLVLVADAPADLVTPFAEAAGFDDVLANAYEVVDGRFTGRLDLGVASGVGGAAAIEGWSLTHDLNLADCFGCGGSLGGLGMLTAIGHPRAVHPNATLGAVARARRWPVERWDRPPGVPSVFGFEPYHLLRLLFRPLLFPFARFEVTGLANVPRRGPVLLASNHRSFFDVAAMGMVAARVGRPIRFLATEDAFRNPLMARAAKAFGGIPVGKEHGSAAAYAPAEAALRAGELLIILPQGTIPRGEAFFDPVLRGRTGIARLAAASGATVIPIGLWGTDRVWPRSSRLPDVGAVVHPHRVEIRIGQPVALGLSDPAEDTRAVMTAISDLLPEEARQPHEPTPEELARTYPPGAR